MGRIFSKAAPFIVLLTAWYISMKSEGMSIAMRSLLSILPYVFALLTIILSIWFQNGNYFYFSCFILASYIFLAALSDKPAAIIEVTRILSLFLPVNALWLNFSQERGIASSYGRNKAIIIVAQIIWLLTVAIGKSKTVLPETTAQAVINLKAPAIALFILCIFVLFMDYFLKLNYSSLVYIAILFSNFIMLHFAHKPVIVSVFTSAAFVVILISLLEISYSLAFYDPLTGVLSRRALEKELLKLGSKYCIAMIDIDHFKHINDCFGHDVGDEVLKMVASVLYQKAGKFKVFRYGGEEFVVLFAGMSYNNVVPELENIRKAIAQRAFIIRDKNRPKEKPKKVSGNVSKLGKSINITVSIGVAQKNSQLKTPYDVIKKADEALYKSKNSGRNCITKA